MNWAHAIVSGLVVGLTYWIIKHLGLLENKSKGQQALVIMPVIFVVVLILNLIWPV